VLSNLGPGGATLAVTIAVGAAAAEFIVGPIQQPADAFACVNGMVLQQGQSCRVDVRFGPAMNGDRSASLQIVSSGAAPTAVALSGTGMSGAAAGLMVSAQALDLGNVRQGASSAPVDVVLSSSGSGSLSVTAITVSGPFALQNRTCPESPFVLAPGASCSIGVLFSPASEGSGAGTLSISSNAATGRADIQLSGQGQAAPDITSGGCSIVNGSGDQDPLLWLMCLGAVSVLWRRAVRRRNGRDR
jgi:hypothetical protein